MKTLNKKTIIISFSALALGLLMGWVFFGNLSGQKIEENHNSTMEAAGKTVWTCSMHPRIRSDKPGQCPICGMELIPLEGQGDHENEEIDRRAVSMSPTAMQLANIQTLTVRSGGVSKKIYLNGKVQADERLLFTQPSHIPGRIEKLMINFTGKFVKEGQVIAYVYSPELVNAQEELFEAHAISKTQPELFQAAKEKLKNWKLSNRQIDKIILSNQIIDQFPILANVSGYVTKKLINLGDYVKLGQPIYEITDLSKVWVLFDVYESEMTWVKTGDKVTYTIESLPGKTFTSRISYIDPTINPQTRVAQARVEMSNRTLQLKPEMFASGIIESKVNTQANTIIIPKTAVMWTGKRSVVYVKKTSGKGINFIMREVVLGPAAGQSFIIESGLQAGEEVAVNGTFSIDAAAQLAGKPSMMEPEGGAAMGMMGMGMGMPKQHQDGMMKSSTKTPDVTQKVSVDKNVKKALQPLFAAYFKMKSALSDDDFETAKKEGLECKAYLSKINMSLFKGTAHNIWMKHSSALNNQLQHIQHIQSIKALREQFAAISSAVIAMAESFGPFTTTLYVQHCPMANANKGADWLSREKEIINPYLGKAMSTCGKISKTLKLKNNTKKRTPHPNQS